MKRSFKKLIAFVAFLALTIQMFALPDTQAGAASSDFTISEYGSVSYNGNSTKITYPKDSAAESVYLDDNDTVKEIVIPEGYTNVSIYSCEKLEKLTLPSTVNYLYLSYNKSLKELTIPKACTQVYIYCSNNLSKVTFEEGTAGAEGNYYCLYDCASLKSVKLPSQAYGVVLSYCPALETATLPATLEGLELIDLPALKSANLPKNLATLYVSNVPFSALKDESDIYDIEDGAIYIDKTTLYAIDTTQKEINVRPGTIETQYLGVSGDCYTTTINLPDSLESIGDGTFAGITTLKTVNLPKNLISLHGYVFEGTAVEKLTIPASLEYIEEDAFYDFSGTVVLGKNVTNFFEYDDCLYAYYVYDNEQYSTLLYVPKNKTSIKFHPTTSAIGASAFSYSSIKELNIPEGVYSFYTNLYGSAVTSISVPTTVMYIDENAINSAEQLKKFTVAAGNEYYASYKNCLYTKDYSFLYAIPRTATNVVIHKDCISAADYALTNCWFEDYKEKELTVTFPKNFVTMGTYSIDLMRVYADSPMAELVDNYNNITVPSWFEGYDDEYDIDYSYYIQDYELVDTSKEILNQIYVQDVVTVKAKKTASAQILIPYGLNCVSKLGISNTDVVIKFSSSNKKIAKVNSTTGVITGVKKGTCTINVKCTVTDGKKKTSKTFKIAVKVK